MKTCISCNSNSSDLWYKGPTCKKCYKRSHYLKNREKLIQKRCAYYRQNKDKCHQQYYDKKKKDPAFRAACNVRNRVFRLIQDNNYVHSSSIGCSKAKFKEYLEAQFQPGMTWDNYGKWHVDHIYPLSKAFKEGAEAFKKACHYTNLQPLWAQDNRSKSNK